MIFMLVGLIVISGIATVNQLHNLAKLRKSYKDVQEQQKRLAIDLLREMREGLRQREINVLQKLQEGELKINLIQKREINVLQKLQEGEEELKIDLIQKIREIEQKRQEVNLIKRLQELREKRPRIIIREIEQKRQEVNLIKKLRELREERRWNITPQIEQNRQELNLIKKILGYEKRDDGT